MQVKKLNLKGQAKVKKAKQDRNGKKHKKVFLSG